MVNRPSGRSKKVQTCWLPESLQFLPLPQQEGVLRTMLPHASGVPKVRPVQKKSLPGPRLDTSRPTKAVDFDLGCRPFREAPYTRTIDALKQHRFEHTRLHQKRQVFSFEALRLPITLRGSQGQEDNPHIFGSETLEDGNYSMG